ncbi:hypothetical protein QBZ16_000841 [Prototheca wickerhamii]|uniref:Amidohydrolase-related domain-containing protein n=1 Tax=Prototheca wickerhamii TaxID=3111 RepID=A0AAD9IHN4_PROWI|nr:hypothetical protein QBZ16_000841 [Prototheca wickerhamii]
MTAASGGVPRVVPEETVLYTDILRLATCHDDLGDISDASILVRGNVIAWVGPTASLPAAEREAAVRTVSLAGQVVIPGLVNTHHHMYQTLTRCVAQDSQLFGWLTSLYPAWSTMRGEDVYVSAKLAMSELILSGCTTSSDHLYIYPNDVLLDDTIRAAREVGLRFLATRGIMTLGASSGGLPPDDCVERAEAALADAERLIAQFHDASRYATLRIGLAPCSPFSVTDEVMRGAAAVAERHERVRLHTHLAENDEDVAYSQRRYGCRPGAYVRRMGWEHDRSWFAHCVKLDAGERAQFREAGMAVAHCPSSNLRLASGICPVRRLLDDGVTVALGVDGSASNDGSNLLQEARLALLLQRAGGDASGLRVREALRLATRGGAVALGWADAIGQIAPGFAADFVGWQTRGNLSMAGALRDPVSALLLCDPGRVTTSVINGEQIVADGALLTQDLETLIEDHNARSARICSVITDAPEA